MDKRPTFDGAAPEARVLMPRPLPDWYDDAKLGVFVHWGPYSVPGWAPRGPDIQTLLHDHGPSELLRRMPYAEWYRNSMAIPGSPTWAHHRATYGADAAYDDFIPAFDQASAAADLAAIAELAAAAGARYLVLTAKHADGFALWPSAVAHPRKGAYHAQRDLVGGLAAAVRARGLRLGVYYCGGYDWAYTGAALRRGADLLLAIPTTREYERFAAAQVRELVARYAPDILWGDVAWPVGAELAALIADYRAAVPAGVVNDRFAVIPGLDGRARRALLRVAGRVTEALWSRLPAARRRLVFPPSPLADFTTPEYEVPTHPTGKWEMTRGVGHSFGANRAERPEDIVSAAALTRLLCDVVARNGNLLIGVGPDAAGAIPAAQAAPLLGLGAWLRANGEAIHGTRPWALAATTTSDGTAVRFTRRAGVVYALLLARPGTETFSVAGIDAASVSETTHLATGTALARGARAGALALTLPAGLPGGDVLAIRLGSGVRRSG